MKRRSWLLIALLLIVAATALMLLSEEPQPEPSAEPQVRLPRHLGAEELRRMEKRRTLPELLPPAQEDEPEASLRPRDPVLAAIANGKGTAIVIEANAIRHSPIGELLLDCLAADGDELERFKQTSGLDPLKDLDRVAMTDEGLVLSGYLGGVRWGEVFERKAVESSYGDRGRLYRFPLKDGRMRNKLFVTWGDDFAMMADSEDAARATIDRLEGRAEATPTLTENDTYGEIYGVLSAEDLAKMLPDDQAELALRFREAASRVELHVDTSRDVGIVARVNGQNTGQVEDLGKALGGALSLARLKARADGDEDLYELMEYARVRPSGGTFNLELALPMEVLEKQLAWCRDEKLREQHMRERERERESGDAGTGAAEEL